MTDHTIEAHFEMKARAAIEAAAKQGAIIDRMANAALGGSLGANAHSDTLARARALEVYLMVLALLHGLAESTPKGE